MTLSSDILKALLKFLGVILFLDILVSTIEADLLLISDEGQAVLFKTEEFLAASIKLISSVSSSKEKDDMSKKYKLDILQRKTKVDLGF